MCLSKYLYYFSLNSEEKLKNFDKKKKIEDEILFFNAKELKEFVSDLQIFHNESYKKISFLFEKKQFLPSIVKN